MKSLRRAWWTIGLLAISLLGSFTWAPPLAFSAWTVGTPIVTYYGGPGRGRTEEGFQTNASATQLAQGGWNLVWANTIEELNTVQAHGLRAMWTGSLDDATVNSIRDNPALYSYYIADEPSAWQFASLASTVSRLRTLDPDRMAYINLFPSYASSAQLGTSDYPTYLSQYMSIVQPSLLSYDNYQFFHGPADSPEYFKNLAIISHTAKQAGIPFLNIVQTCSFAASVRVPNGNELRYLYNTSLAYGASGVSDFVYHVNLPDFTGGMANDDGTTTALYESAKTLNPEFVALAEQVQSLNHIGAYHLGDLPPGFDLPSGSAPMRLPDDSPFTISPDIQDTTYVAYQPVRGVVLGLYGSDDQIADATCTLVVNLDYSNDLTTRVFGPENLSIFDTATGTWIAQNHAWADVSMLPGGSALVGLTAMVSETIPGNADSILIHRGATNPLTEGWVPVVSGVGSAGAVTDDLGTGIDAWRTTDTGSEAGTAYYKGESGLTAQDLSDIATKGWSMSATLRVDDTIANGFDQTPGIAPGLQVAFQDPGIWALLSLGSDNLGNTELSFKGGYPFGSTITYNIPGNGYNDYEMTWNPTDGLDVLVNGEVVIDNYDCSTSESMAAGLGNRIYWGTMDTPGEGSGYWSSVDFKIVRIPGDANGDGVVDGSDVTILAGNWQVGVADGLTATRAMGDFNGDGKVDGSDVTILAGNWQYGVTAAATAVPEPGGGVLLLAILFAVAVFFPGKKSC